MGTSKRLAWHYDRLMEETIIERFIATAGPLQTLTPDELELATAPVTIYPVPPKVRVWVRFGPESTRVDARLLRSTDKAAGIEFTVKGRAYRCWVWGNAVTEAPRPTP
ncbi:hypothetical protein [Microbacterium maritypicum]